MWFFSHNSKPFFTCIKKGKEKECGIVIGSKNDGWRLDTVSNNFAVHGNGAFKQMIALAVAYRTKASNAQGSLLLEASDIEMLAPISEQLKESGYCIVRYDEDSVSDSLELLCAQFSENPTVVIADRKNLFCFIECMVHHLLLRYENGKLPFSMTVFTTRASVIENNLIFAMAQKRNIKFVVNMQCVNLENIMPNFCDSMIIEGSAVGNADAKVYIRGHVPVANGMSVLI